MHAHRVKLLDNLDHVRCIAAQPVQLGDQDNVSFPDFYLQDLKSWPVGIAAGRLVIKYPRCFHSAAFRALNCNSRDERLETYAYPKSSNALLPESQAIVNME